MMVGIAGASADDVCDEPIDHPVAVPWRSGGWDAGRGGCLAADVGAAVHGHALVDTPAFYGTLGGELVAGVRLREGARYEWGIAARAVEVAFVQNAVWTVLEPSYGPLSVSGAIGRPLTLAGRSAHLALAATVELPFTRSEVSGSTGAAQLAAIVSWRARSRLVVHGRAALLGWYGADVTGTSARGAGLVSIDAGWRAIRWLTVDVGVDAQSGWYGWGLDHVAVRAGGHWRVKGPWRVGVAAGLPLVGSERQDLAVGLMVRRDL